jgi:hypothetical protein
MNQDEAFEVFDEKLKLNPIERAGVIRLHNEITAVLVAAGVIVRAFLQGSFARKTMLGPCGTWTRSPSWPGVWPTGLTLAPCRCWP